MKKYTEDDLMEYCKEHWYDNEQWPDLNVFMDEGYLMLVISRLIGAGAIDPGQSYQPELEQACLDLVKDYNHEHETKDIDECLKGYSIYINPNTNEHAFINSTHCVTEESMKESGYAFDCHWDDIGKDKL